MDKHKLVEAAYREGFQHARECLSDDEAFALTEDVEEDCWCDSKARAALRSHGRAMREFAFGDDQWPGLAKLVEECGEVIQVVGKLMMVHGSPAHWSGNLREQLMEELGDLRAAADFVDAHCFTARERVAIETRRIAKMVKFMDWHADMDADPPPPLEPKD